MNVEWKDCSELMGRLLFHFSTFAWVSSKNMDHIGLGYGGSLKGTNTQHIVVIWVKAVDG